MMLNLRLRHAALTAVAAALAACGGGGGGHHSDGGSTQPPARPTVGCTVDTTVQLAYEERRLETPLPYTGGNVVGTDSRPFATRILADTGFDGFAPAFADVLCKDGKTEVTSYDEALSMVKEQGAALWRAAIDRVQGRRASPAGSKLPNSDDRMLYWARVQMTKELRQWKPEFALTPAQAEELQLQFERASRGQYDIDFPTGTTPDGKKYRRLLISGFDVFTLGIPGTPNTGMRNGNPSAETVMAMDGQEYTLSDGSILHVEAYILPVSYPPFHRGMQEDTLGPWFKEGPKRVDASISMSQGSSNVFNLEQWNGRYHGTSAGNDGQIWCPATNSTFVPGATRLPAYELPLGTVTAADTDPITDIGSGCSINPPQRWLGYNSQTMWMKDYPPQFIHASLPIAAMVTANTQKGILRPPGATSQGTEGFDVTLHSNYTYFADCEVNATTNVASNGVMNSMPDMSTLTPIKSEWCAQSGGGGNYLSNESAYRNTLLRDVFKLNIPAGHIHVPVVNNFYTAATGGTRDDNAMSDGRFEAYQAAIVGQGINLVKVVGESLILE